MAEKEFRGASGLLYIKMLCRPNAHEIKRPQGGEEEGREEQTEVKLLRG